MSYLIPGLLKKTITFRRLGTKNVLKYEVYASYKDSSYASGIRQELLDTIPNPSVPDPHVVRITLPYNDNATWDLPEDAYLDRDHQFHLYLNGFILSNMAYAFNRVAKLITLDTVMKQYDVNSKLEMVYYHDSITTSYMLSDDCELRVKPICTDSYTFGTHNVII